MKVMILVVRTPLRFFVEFSCIRARKLLSLRPSQQTRNRARCRLPWSRNRNVNKLQQTQNH
jgi:hypothetical protein